MGKRQKVHKHGPWQMNSHFPNGQMKSERAANRVKLADRLSFLFIVDEYVCLPFCMFVCLSVSLYGRLSISLACSFIKYLAPGIVHIVKCKYETDVEVVEYIH